MRGISLLLAFVLSSLSALALTPNENVTNLSRLVKAELINPVGGTNGRIADIGMTNRQIVAPTNILSDSLWIGGRTASPRVVVGTNQSSGLGDNYILNVVGTSSQSDELMGLQNTDPTKRAGFNLHTWDGVVKGYLFYSNTNNTSASGYSNYVELAANGIPLHLRADTHLGNVYPIRFVIDTNFAAEVRTNGDFWIAGNFLGNFDSTVYAVTNWQPSPSEFTWNFGNLPNLNGTETMALLRTVGFHPVAANAGLLSTVSNLVCVTNIPGVKNSGIFMHQWTQGSNAPTLYMTYSNRWTTFFGNQIIASVKVLGTWVTNEATVSGFTFHRYPNLASATNIFMNSGDAFALNGRNFHFNLFRNGNQLTIYTNALTGDYTAENSLGRVWVDRSDFDQPGGALSDVANSQLWAWPVANHNVRWEIGWEILNETCVRVFAGPNELIRTIDGLTQWQPMRSFWYEDVSNDSTSTNRGLSFLLHSITVSTHPSSTWPVGAYYETNGAAPYGALTFKGNRVLANSASVSNAPAGQQDVVRLRDLSSLTNGDFSILSAFGSDANPVDTRWTNLTGFKGYLVVATVLSVPAANDDAGLYMTNVTKNKVYFDGVFTSVLTPLGVQSTLRYRCGTNDVVHFKGATTGTGEMAISDSWFETD